MPVNQADDEARFASLDEVIRRHNASPNALIEVLHAAERQDGYLRRDVLRYVAAALDLPPSKVFGVATFYHFFSLVPRAEHECTVCVGTTCYVKDAEDIVEAVEREFDIARGCATPDGSLKLSVARCVGNCCHAPLVMLDDEVMGAATPSGTIERIRAKRKRESTPFRKTSKAER